MPIPFENIPASTLVPLFWAEVKPAQAPYIEQNKLLIIGHKWTTSANTNVGTADLNRVYPISGDNAIELFGPGSLIDAMYRKARKQNRFRAIYGMAVAEPDAGVKADATITVLSAASLTAKKFGMMQINIGGKVVAIRVNPTDTQAVIASRLKLEINKSSSLAVTAITHKDNYPAAGGAVDDTKVRLIAKHAGAYGNAIKISFDPSGSASVRTLAERMLSKTGFANGSGNPTMATGLAALSDERFDTIALAFDAKAVLDSMTTFMDHDSGRWSAYQQVYGHVVACRSASLATLLTNSEDYNDPHLTLVGVQGSPDPTWEVAAAFAAKLNHHLEAPPEMSRPVQGIELVGVQPPSLDDRWNISERNQLHEAGIATCDVSSDGRVRINRAVTTYKYNTWGVRDASWRDAETLYQASFYVRSVRAMLTGLFPRAALTDDDKAIPGFASPGKIYDAIVHHYKGLDALGLVENPDLFAQALVVERNDLDANRVDILIRPDMVNQLRVIATLVETHLQLKDSFAIDGNDITEPEA